MINMFDLVSILLLYIYYYILLLYKKDFWVRISHSKVIFLILLCSFSTYIFRRVFNCWNDWSIFPYSSYQMIYYLFKKKNSYKNCPCLYNIKFSCPTFFPIFLKGFINIQLYNFISCKVDKLFPGIYKKFK